MSRLEQKEKIINYIVMHSNSIFINNTKMISDRFNVTPQTVNRYIDELEQEAILESIGIGRGKKYRLVSKEESYVYDLNVTEKDEYEIWLKVKKDFEFLLDKKKKNVYNILQHGITEIVNNVFDHSSGNFMTVITRTTVNHCEVIVIDDGIGIFKKIQDDFKLIDIRHSILELAKGKLTSDEQRHSGEGIFFTSKMFDIFYILSNELYFNHDSSAKKDYLHALENNLERGTLVMMKISNDSKLTSKEVFDQFAMPDEFTFAKTEIPVELMQIDSDLLVSRSQAKRLISRFDQFKEVILNFANVDMIGQAFADEIFRVFVNANPEVEIHKINANDAVESMIGRVTAK